MKIAFLNIYAGVNLRGAESFTSGLAKELKKNHDVWIFGGGEREPSANYNFISIQTGVKQPEHNFPQNLLAGFLKRIFLNSAALSVLFFTLKSLPFLWKEKFDVVIPTNGFWQVILCKVVTFFKKGKILIIGLSGPGWDELWNLYLKPDVFVATTGPTAQWAKKSCFWTRIEVIPFAVDLVKFAKCRRLNLNLPHPLILCIAAAVPYKRVDTVIRAVAKLGKGSLLYMGSGPLLNELNNLAKKLLGEGRYLNLTVSYDKLPDYYHACDVFTLPSTDQENAPMVVIEAIAANKAVISTDAPRLRWMLGDAGLYVDPENTEEYAATLQKALDINWGNKPRIQAEKYSWDKIVNQYEKLFY